MMIDYDIKLDVILQDDVSYGKTEYQNGMGGMRRRHVMRVGEPVNVDMWLAQIPVQSRDEAHWMPFISGNQIVRHHLTIWWPCREAITLVRAGVEIPAVFWRGQKDQRASELILTAATDYLARCECWPAQALVPDKVTAPERMSLGEGHPEIRIEAAGWVPNRCVCVN